MTDRWYIDYSAKKLDGVTIRNAGYVGAIRYVGGSSAKHTNAAEYASIKAAGLDFLAVLEISTGDANGGWNAGVANAKKAKAHCDSLGYQGVIFFCNDTPTLASVTNWQAYLDGAASVLGKGRVGAYGFRNAMLAAQGHAVAFWQAGRRSDVVPFANFWQDNNYQPVTGGISSDRNLVLAPMPGVAAAPEEKKEEEDDFMVKFYKGDSTGLVDPKNPKGAKWGDYVFKVEFCHDGGAIAVRTLVPNPEDPGYKAYLAAGGKVVTLPQAVLDAIPNKAAK